MWHEQQQQFAEALLDPDLQTPESIAQGSDGLPAGGFNIYRNNVMAGLSDSLAATYPVTTSLVGEAFFRAMAKAFIRHAPPETPVVMNYGDGLANFIGHFPGLENLPYLADIARLEWAYSRSFHSADAAPIPVSALANIDDTALEVIRLRLHPSVRLLQSDWPVVSIWQAHQGETPDVSLAALPQGGESALIVRPHFDVAIRTVDACAFAALSAFRDGKTLGDGLDLLSGSGAGTIDPSAYLVELFSTGSIIGLE